MTASAPLLPTKPQATIAPKKITYGLELEQLHLLERLFEHYCRFGDAMNHTSLKSSMFVKMMKEAGLVWNTSPPVNVKIMQISITEVDIMFKQFACKTQVLKFDNYLRALANVAHTCLQF
jgi:hypothetical protein